jgi:hypothetical protein
MKTIPWTQSHFVGLCITLYDCFIGINGINLPGNAGSICRIIIPGYALRLFCFIAFLQRQITEDLSIYIE